MDRRQRAASALRASLKNRHDSLSTCPTLSTLCENTDSLGQLPSPPSRLTATPRVSDIKVSATEADFRFSGTEEDQAQLLSQLIAQGIRVTTFREVRQTVEEMYMKLSTHEVM